MVYVADWGYELSQYADTHAKSAEMSEVAVCAETGVRVATDLKQHLRDAAKAQLGSLYDEILAMADTTFELYAENNTLEVSSLKFYYGNMSPMLGKDYPNCDEIAEYQQAGLKRGWRGDVTAEALTWFYIFGPVAVNEFAKQWYRCVRGASSGTDTIRLVDCGVLKGGASIGVVFAHTATSAHYLYKVARDPHDSIVELIEHDLNHILTDAMKNNLLKKIGAMEQQEWETVEVEQGEVDRNNPDWATLQQGTDVCSFWGYQMGSNLEGMKCVHSASPRGRIILYFFLSPHEGGNRNKAF